MFGAEIVRLFLPLLVLWALGVGGGSAQTVGSVRLTGGSSSSEGRVEVFWFGMWGTVCDDHWGLRDATVVCRELGYSSVASEHTKFDAGSGPIFLDDVHCSGGEVQLQNCPHADWGLNDCTHEEDVGVVCSNATAVNETIALPEEVKTYRLYGGASSSEGVLQFRSSANETWNTVCSSWLLIDPGMGAEPCKLLGYKVSCSCDPVARVQGFSAPPGFGDFPLKKADISCGGSSEGIFDCNLVTEVKNTQICSLDEAIWVVCGSDLDVRLASVVHENEGILQARCKNTQRWYDVCGNDHWTFFEESARVACRHLGFSGSPHVLPYLVTASIFPNILDWISCSGEEESLTTCEFWQPFGYPCETHVGLRCIGKEEILELGLVDSQFEASGLVVSRFGTNDEWGAICRGSHWDSRDAQVTCRHLGFHSSINVRRGDIVYDASELPTFAAISDVGCLGNETELTQCGLVSGGGASCSAFAYVECIAETERFAVPAFLCGEIHYCGFNCNQGPRNTHRPIKEETCKCDDACAFFNDCCYDYQSSCKPNHDLRDVRINGVDIKHYACVWIPKERRQLQAEYFGFALVSLCPKQWHDPFLRRHCEEVADKNDIIGSLPVYDSQGAVYKNIFCAICQGADLGDLHKWTVSLEYEESDNVTYDARFNLTISGTLTGNYVFEPPAGILGSARTCPVKTIDSCHDEFVNTSLQAACKDYFAPLTVNGIGFHNPHCAMCNGLTVEPIATCGPLCTPLCSTEDKWVHCAEVCAVPGGPLNIEALFDFGWGTDKKKSMCQPEELFDPFLSRCRTVLCMSGMTNKDGGCILDSSLLPQQTSRWFSLLDANCTALINASFGLDVIFWQATPTGEIGPMDNTRRDFLISVIVEHFEFIEKPVSDFVATLENHTDYTRHCNISVLIVYVLEGVPLLSGIYYCANATLEARDVLYASAYNISTLEFNVYPRYTWVKNHSTTTRNLAMPQECLDILELKCEEVVLLHADEHESGGVAQYIRHIPTGHEFEPSEYVFLPSGKAAVCRPARWTDPHADALGYISLVCSSLSLLALVATFVTYCAFPTLRNIAGMHTMNLMVALFVAFLTFILVGNLGLEGRICLATAAILHLSWLSAFFWMAILSCNAALTFGRRIRVIPSGSKPSYRPLLAAMVCSWGGALLVVSSCLVISLCDCTDLPSIYSESPPCLITGENVRLVVFGAPLAASLLVSSLCFIFVVYKVRKAKRDSKMVQRKGQMKETLEEVKIYAKLALLFGITWILLFVSGAVDHIILSYISTIINTMQGVFIFVTFCLNQKVRGLWKDRMGKQREGSKKLAASDRKQTPKQSAAVVSSGSSGTEDTRL